MAGVIRPRQRTLAEQASVQTTVQIGRGDGLQNAERFDDSRASEEAGYGAKRPQLTIYL